MVVAVFVIAISGCGSSKTDAGQQPPSTATIQQPPSTATTTTQPTQVVAAVRDALVNGRSAAGTIAQSDEDKRDARSAKISCDTPHAGATRCDVRFASGDAFVYHVRLSAGQASILSVNGPQ